MPWEPEYKIETVVLKFKEEPKWGGCCCCLIIILLILMANANR